MSLDPNVFSSTGSTTPRRPGAAAAQSAPSLPETFNGLARLAADVCNAPMASIAFAGWGQYWSADAPAAPLSHDPFFEHAMRAPNLFEVPDAAADPRFRGSKVQAGASTIRFYAGYVLRATSGDALGVLAVYRALPYELTAAQRGMLELIARQCAVQAELHTRIAELEFLCKSQAAPATTTASKSTASRPEADTAIVRALLESAPVAVYHSDSSTDLNYCNPAYRRIFGLGPEQSPDDWAMGVHPEDRPRIEALWKDFRKRPRSLRFDYRTLQSDGTVRFHTEQVAAVEGVPGFVGTISDFTDLVTARDDLRKAESLFHNTFDQAPIGIAYADRGGVFLRFNEALCELLGYAPHEFIGQSSGALTHSEDSIAAGALLERLWNGDIPAVDIEKRYRRKDGSFAWVRSTTALVREGGAILSSVEYLRDITQRKGLSEALLQQQTLLEAVIIDLPVALLVCDAAGNLTHYNRAAVDMFRMKVTDPTTTQTSEPYPLDVDVYFADGTTAVERANRPLARALRSETISNLELVVAPRDGTSPRSTLSSSRRLLGQDGQTLGAVAVIQDTTDIKHRELELERVHKELMTASRQAGMAEVATNVLHNVGNILNSVNISASLVAERVRQSKAPGVARLAGLLLEQGDRCGRFIAEDERGKRIPEYLAALGGQLLTDQKMALEELASLRENLEHIKDTVTMQQSYAKLCGVTEIVEVVDLVEDSLRLNAGAFARHGVTLRRDFGAVPPITVDKHKVLQILVNLVRNAKYACDESGRTDKLITLRVEAAPRCVRISVIDNGIGIPPENMGRLFSHGFTTRQSGHGFGLHSGALAAQELGGTLHAESQGTGHGAAFVLDLPVTPP